MKEEIKEEIKEDILKAIYNTDLRNAYVGYSDPPDIEDAGILLDALLQKYEIVPKQ